MKVLMLISTLKGGGAEKVAVWLCESLSKQGHEVTLTTFSNEADDTYIPFELVNRTSLNVYGESKSFFHSLIQNIKRVNAVRREITREKYDVVVAFFPEVACTALLALTSLNCRVVVSERNADSFVSLSRFWHVCRKYLYRKSNAVVVLTESARTWINNNTMAKNIVVIPNAAVSSGKQISDPVNPLNIVSESHKYILAVGSLSYQKGFDVLIEAFSHATIDRSLYKLVILGGEPDDNSQLYKLKRLISQKGLEDCVILPGRVGNVSDWYQSADLFVLSSRYEGMPNALMEAMQCGCPVISTDCETGPSELIDNGINGILVPVDDIGAISAAISAVVLDSILKARLARNATEINSKFSEERVLQQWIRVLSE